MRVHNLVKDVVVQKVEELLANPEDPQAKLLAGDMGAKFDVICYVLNRTPPMYVVSGRGIAHREAEDFRSKNQHLADITRLAREAMESVAARRRERVQGAFEQPHLGPYFNFPSIIGRMFSGVDFSPVHDLVVGLYQNGSLVKVIDPNWQNPYHLVLNTAGTYLFWPHPQEAEVDETRRSFDFEVRVDDPRYEPLHYYFSLTSQAEPEFIDFVNTTASTRLKDLYLFPRD